MRKLCMTNGYTVNTFNTLTTKIFTTLWNVKWFLIVYFLFWRTKVIFFTIKIIEKPCGNSCLREINAFQYFIADTNCYLKKIIGYCS